MVYLLKQYKYKLFYHLRGVHFKFSLAGEDLPLPAACLSGRQGRHQPGRTAVVGVPTEHNQNEVRKFEMHPLRAGQLKQLLWHCCTIY
jgi:hypothetical protein